MSAPEVGDRVRVTAGQWRMRLGDVTFEWPDGWREVDFGGWRRPLHVDDLEKVPETRENRPRSDAGADPVPVEGRDADGARRGAER